MQGWRIEMEDAHHAVIGLPHGLDEWSFFAVFDGHAGARVSAHCAENLLNSIIANEGMTKGFLNGKTENCENSSGDCNSADGSSSSPETATLTLEQIESVKRAIREGFLRLDETMKTLPEVESGQDKSGSTAICALVSPTHVFIANCGDSRAVLSRNGKVAFSTEDHKPINPAEKDRIQKAGGSVMIQRVNGSLAVSRALGDYEYKQVEGKGPCEQLVSPEPEITVHARDPNDEFLVLACDGIWDVMSNDDLCDYIRHQLTITHDLRSICSSIIDTCLHKGSKDNMSVVLVKMPGGPQLSEEAQQKDRELNKYIEGRVEALLAEDPSVGLLSVIQTLACEDIENLPPGAGLDAKRQLIEDVFNRLNPNRSDDSKEGTMTLPYHSMFEGRDDQILDDLIKESEND